MQKHDEQDTPRLNVKAACVLHCGSVQRAAKKLGINATTMSLIIQRHREPTDAQRTVIKRHLGVDVD